MALPNIAPSDRGFDPGTEYVADRQWREGGSTRRHYGQEVEGQLLRLVFENIDDAIAAQFLAEYEQAGPLLPVSLPEAFTAGMDQSLKDAIALSGGEWFFSDAPDVRSVKPGVSTVQASFSLDVNSASAVGGNTEPGGATFCVPAPPAPPEPPAP